jgi:hypothetical protein
MTQDSTPPAPADPAANDALDQPSASAAECAGRLVVAVALAALLYAAWTPWLTSVGGWSAKELRILPRMSVFALTALIALVVQGARAPRPALLLGGLLAAGGAAALLPSVELWSFVPSEDAGDTPHGGAGRGVMLFAAPVLQWFAFELSLLGAVLLGSWLGRGVKDCAGLVALLCCAIAGDVWLTTFHVPESVPPTHLLRLLRLPWPAGEDGMPPAFTDLLFLCATLEAGRNLGFHLFSVVLGAASGYCAGSFLSLDPWPAWPSACMLLFTTGVLVSCWPQLRCGLVDTGRALLIASVLLATLLALASLHRKLHPRPAPPAEPAPGRYRNVIDARRHPRQQELVTKQNASRAGPRSAGSVC